jgi:excinuclease ABC subunit C
MKIMNILNLNIPVIGLAKKNEYIFQMNKKSPIILNQKSLALKLLQQVRDEAHRFSNTRLSRKYKNETLESKLTLITGVGKNRMNELIRTFGSIEELKKADLKKISETKGIGADLAKKIFEFLHL